MGRIKSLKAILFLLGFIPFLVTGQNYPRFELYQLKQGTDSGQFIVTGLDSNLAFNNILRFRSADSTFLIGTDTIITDQSIIPILLRTIDAGLGIDVNQVDNQIFIESLSIEDSIYNGTGTLIAKGTPLYAVGVQGNYWSVAPADASDPSKMPVVVIAGDDIASGGTGLGLIKGHIKQVNTTGLADGAEVYVASGGGYTSTKPTAEGVIIQRLGTVIKGNTTNGSGIINLGDEAYWNDYVDRTELGDSLILYPNRTELSDTASAIRTDIPLIINDSLTARNFLTEEVDGSVTNELQTLSKLALDITLSDGGGTVRDSILTEAQVDNYVSNNGYLTSEIDGSVTNELQTISTSGAAGNITLSDGGGTLNLNVNDADASTTNEIQNISTSGAAGNISISSGSTLTLNVNDADASATNEGSLTVGAGTASTSVISSNTSGSTDVTLTAGSNITLSETGNNITIAASGGSSLWSEGATTGEIYYNSGNVGIGLTDPNFPLHVSGDIYSSDDIFVDDELVFGNVADGSVPYIDNLANYMYLSVNASSGTLFNFRDKYASTNPFTINANNAATILDFNGTSDFNGAMNIEGNLTQSGSIVQDGGSVTFNNTQNGSYDFGVGSLNHLPFMWVDASADKMAVGGGTPAYTLDVTGDINFTGDLYDNGSLVSFTGTTINNNADNRIITGSSTANTLNGETGLTWDGTTLNADGIVRIAYNSASGGGYYLRNTSTGLTSNNGIAMSLDLTDFYLTNYENAGIILTTNNNANQRLILKNDGTVQFTAYGSGTLSTDASGNISASDGRFKTVTRTMNDGLNKVMKLKPLYYRWNEDSGFNTEFEEAGFIAQDVKKVIPEAVPNEEEENRKLNYSDRAIIATLTKAIQEQQEMIAELQKEIKRIKRKIK